MPCFQASDDHHATRWIAPARHVLTLKCARSPFLVSGYQFGAGSSEWNACENIRRVSQQTDDMKEGWAGTESGTTRPSIPPTYISVSLTQNENAAWMKTRRAAEPCEKIPNARLFDCPKLGEFTVPIGCPRSMSLKRFNACTLKLSEYLWPVLALPPIGPRPPPPNPPPPKPPPPNPPRPPPPPPPGGGPPGPPGPPPPGF